MTAVLPALLVALLGCRAPLDPVVAQRASVEPLRAQLHALERELVKGQLEAARAGDDPVAVAQAEQVARALGLIPEPPPALAPLDGRQQGVGLAHGKAVLDGVRAEYVTPIEEAGWATAARDVLGEAGDSPEAVITAAVAAGRPADEAVVMGVEAALGALDGHTRAVWPAQVAAWTRHHAGVQVGIGLDLHEPTPGRVAVKTPWPGGSAYAAGVHQGDRLVAVDGQPVTTLDEAQVAIAGEVGGTAALDLLRGEQPLTLSVPRAETPQATVRGWARRDDHGYDLAVAPGVAYLRVLAVRPDTDDQLLALVGDTRWEGVVVDLRGNGGGDVQAAVHLVDAWIDEGEVAHMVGRRAPRPDPPEEGMLAWNQTRPGGPFVGVPTVVLVDRDTASAAEIVAGALQQLAGAFVIGETTHGKGSSQALRADAEVGVAWQVTNLSWALPDGRVLAPGSGVVPDVKMQTSPAETWQLRRLAAQREHPLRHADGSSMAWRGPSVRAELPALAGDAFVLEALVALSRR